MSFCNAEFNLLWPQGVKVEIHDLDVFTEDIDWKIQSLQNTQLRLHSSGDFKEN